MIRRAKERIKTIYLSLEKNDENSEISMTSPSSSNLNSNVVAAYSPEAITQRTQNTQTQTTPVATMRNESTIKKFKPKNFIKTFMDKSWFCSEKSNSENNLDSELDRYFLQKIAIDETNESEIEELGPLYFFNIFEDSYPKLSKIAKIVFSITATSVPSEALFSQVGLIQTELRNRLNPNLLESLTLLKENN